MEHLDGDALDAFVRGTLEPRIYEYWAAHLRECPRCQEAVEKHQKLSKLLRLTDQPVQLADGAERALARIAQAIRPAGQRPRLPRLLLSVAAGLACGAGAGWGIARAVIYTCLERTGAAPPDPAVVANVEPLLTLVEDPWLIDGFEAARCFEELLSASEKLEGSTP
jgi:anti-sigma factor RsiW